jgi:hypothetical protein
MAHEEGAGVADLLAWIKHHTSTKDFACSKTAHARLTVVWCTQASCCQPVNCQADDTRGGSSL